ncbi:TetR/AcrR family transcriptional regulator [Tardiphaga alba]|uniref:TetR/AcrR family transcriptional regulator n=1 Tax=Tardiphaga alba TaxID=340268 RepID=A0ABX8A8U7_9BRAD|nr:TetR/AcrR family transcriptional regulator [Tardiphaga alba]QUS40059.1 TetR/AcrR family transcriptional regulator [Tardiphaga alba]
MTKQLSQQEAEARRLSILTEARWCFLNFGFAKTSFDDIAKRARISRTLLYKIFKDKEDIFTAVFAEWLVSRHPAAKAAVTMRGTAQDRLFEVCRLMVIEPWSDMIGAPMAGEFFDVCERIDPEVEALHRQIVIESATEILGGDSTSAEVFTLALDGLLTDEPPIPVLEQRIRLLAARFAPSNKKERK